MSPTDIACFFTSLVLLLPLAQSDVTLEVEPTEFATHGKNWDGASCDTVGADCDPIFTFCLDEGTGDYNVDHCKYGAYKTGNYQDEDTVSFGSNMKGVSNPMRTTIGTWPGSFRFKIEVVDDDLGNDDLIDKLYHKYTGIPAASESQAAWISKYVDGTRTRAIKTRLDFRFRVYCTQYYFGSACNVYCKAKDDSTGHYTCNSDGEKVCRSGWETASTDCTIKIDNCEGHQCKNGATCVDGYNSYTCRCVDGYTGTTCAENINECLSGPCLHGGLCTDGINRYTCVCTGVYTGDNCQHHLCDVTVHCQNGGMCYGDSPSSIGCLCPVIFMGIHCDVGICDVVECQNGGNCVDGVCNCPPNYIGALCDVFLCEHINCQNGGTCEAGICICPTGYTGQYCHINIDDCKDNECEHDASCEDEVNGYTCSCLPGFSGVYCEVINCYCINGGTCMDGICYCPHNFTGETCEFHICDITSCNNGGSCEIVNEAAHCNCVEGFTGQYCDTDLCQVLECHNGGTCVDGVCDCPPDYIGALCDVLLCEHITCQNRGTCEAGVCICPTGYTGQYCHINIDDCEDNECEHDATCEDEVNGYTCSCLPGYSGVYCEVIDCYCINGGTCMDGVCYCPYNFTGETCEFHICDITSCNNGGSCEIVNEAAHCNCVKGFTGQYCDTDLCQRVRCENGGVCKQGQCECPYHYLGPFCGIHICDLIPCQNGGSCVVIDGVVLCECTDQYQGLSCEEDKCENITCLNNGVCSAGQCVCESDYTGVTCEFHICDVSGCQNGATCSATNGEVVCTCTEDYTGELCDSHKCEEVECQNGGSCLTGVCSCTQDYTGSLCDVDLCQLTDCQNAGTCTAGNCVCVTGFTGQYCHTNIDECLSSPCQHEADCVDKVDGYSCQCEEGYNGTHCEVILSEPGISNTEELNANPIEKTWPLSKAGLGIIIAVVCLAFFIVVVIALLVRRSIGNRHPVSRNTEARRNTEVPQFFNPLYMYGDQAQSRSFAINIHKQPAGNKQRRGADKPARSQSGGMIGHPSTHTFRQWEENAASQMGFRYIYKHSHTRPLTSETTNF